VTHSGVIPAAEDKAYMEIVRHYESCLDEHGDSHLGVDWPKAEHVPVRHRVMLDVMRYSPPSRPRVSLLEFGCGTSHLYEYMREEGITHVDYTGLDISEKFVALSRRKFPENTYVCVDVLREDDALPRFDYVVVNGVFTIKRNLPFTQMFEYFKEVIRRVSAITNIGFAFNVMSEHVDWKRDDLFHLPFDALATFLTAEISRDFIFRNDYRLYEYTTYVFPTELDSDSEHRKGLTHESSSCRP
jgi:SAM-dependent methyltransferase